MIKKILKFCRLSLTNDDAGEYPTSQVEFNEIPTDAYRFSPYGLSANPPVDALGLALMPGCRSDNPVLMADVPIERFKSLKPWEVQLGNYKTKASVFFNEAGDIVIRPSSAGGNVNVIIEDGDASIEVSGDLTATAANATINAPGGNVNVTAATVAITGNLTVTGTIVAQGDIVGATKSLSTHTHPYTDNGSPLVTGIPS